MFTNSTFGAGDYPIVYSNSGCGGWETTLSDCSKQQYPDFSCSRSNVAGVLCGYGTEKHIYSSISIYNQFI